MKISPKVTGALAWTGLVLVLAVPAADMLGGKPEARVNSVTTDAKPAKTVTPVAANPTVKPVAKPVVPAIESAAAGADPVADFVSSGRKLPSYISGNDSPAPTTASVPKAPAVKPGTVTINPDGTIKKPATVPAKPAVADDANVAVIKPNLRAPVPLPASARPKPQTIVTQPPAAKPPLIIDENTVATGPRPPADIEPDPFVSGDQLDEWDSGSLADYLARKGLMSEAANSAPVSGEYDPNGFYLSDGPNNPRRSRAIILDDDATF